MVDLKEKPKSLPEVPLQKPNPQTRMKHLPANLMKIGAEYRRSAWFIKAPRGTIPSDYLDPPWWAHYATQIKVDDLIEVVAEDATFDLLLRVTDVQVGFAKVRLLNKWIGEKAKLAEKEQAARSASLSTTPTEFPCIDFKQATGWRVLGYDGKEVKKNLRSEDDAKLELKAYVERAQAA